MIARDDRFGYVELATAGYRPPSLNPIPMTIEEPSRPPPFISIRRYGGNTHLTFAVEMVFNLEKGECRDWRRIKDMDGEPI